METDCNCHHIDRNKQNNSLDNLRWTTRSINNREGKKQERLKIIQEQIKTIKNGTSRT